MSACLPMYVPGMSLSASSGASSSIQHGNAFPMHAPASLSGFNAAPSMFEAKEASLAAPKSHTQSPIVTGASVLAVKYADGVMLMADTLGSYGNMAMFKELSRLRPVNEYTIIGGGGEYSDFQHILKLLEQLRINDFSMNDGAVLTPKEIHSYLGRVLYNRRSKVDPLWNSLVTAGFYNGQPFLGMTDLYGSTYESDVLATGFGLHLAIPLLRKHADPKMSYDDAKKLLEDCMRVLFYRDCKALNSFQLATITAKGSTVSEPFSVSTHWEAKRQVQPFRAD